MSYYLSIAIRSAAKEKFFEIVDTIEKFSGKIEQTEKDLIIGSSDDVNIISCLIQMKENYPEAHSGFSQYLGIAKGLAKIAEAGEILVSEEIEKKIIEDFEITSLGMLSIAGMSSQILVCRVETPVKKLSFPETKTLKPLIPRKDDFEALKNMLRVTNAILVTGPTGSGVTTFLDQFTEQTQDKEIFRTTCPTYIMDLSLKPIIEIVIQIMGIHGMENIEEKQNTIEKRLKQLGIADIGTSYLALLDFLGLGEDESILEKMDLKTRVEIITRTVAEVIKRIAWSKPVMIIIEDVEHIDVSSVNFIQHLMAKLAEEKVHFIFSSNSTQVNIGGLKGFELSTIPKEELVKLVEDQTGEKLNLPPTTPFHVAQYLLLYKEEIMSYHYDQYLGQTSISDFGLSFYDIKTIIKRRVELLGDKKEFLFNLAIAGTEINPDELPVDKKNHNLFNYLVRSNYLKKYFNHYLFANPMLHREVYNIVPDKEKRHQRLADYYSHIQGYEEYAAFHYREENNYKKAIEFLLKSGDQAVKKGGYDSGISYYSQALDLCQRQGDAVNLEILITLNENLADVYRALGDEKKALRYYKLVLDSYKEILKE